MRFKHLIFVALAGIFVACNGTSKTQQAKTASVRNAPNARVETGYDSIRARKLGADDYGMRRYVMAFLKKGPNRELDAQARQELQRKHLDNITRMAEEGRLVVAGPFMDDGEIRGIYIFAVESVEEARKLTKSDPAIQAGSLVMELKPWYGSAALMEVTGIHRQIARESI